MPSFRKELDPKEWVNWLGPGPGEGGQKNAKTPPLLTLPPANAKRKTKKYFSMSTRRLSESVEGLNSSLALAAGDLWPKNGEVVKGLKQWALSCGPCGLCELFPNVCFSLRIFVIISATQVCTFHVGCKQGIDQQIFKHCGGSKQAVFGEKLAHKAEDNMGLSQTTQSIVIIISHGGGSCFEC